jgi:hypothetical protein
VTGLSNTIARCAPTSRGRSSGWSFCATPTLRFEFLRYKPQSGGYADPPLLKAFEGHFRSVSLLCQSASSIEFLELLAAMEGMEGMEGMEVMEGAGRSRSVRVPFYFTKSAHQVLITRAQLLSLHTFCRSCDRSIARCAPTSRGRSSGWSFCACTRAARVCQRASGIEAGKQATCP